MFGHAVFVSRRVERCINPGRLLVRWRLLLQSSVWILLYVIPVAPIILKWLLFFFVGGIYGPLYMQ